MLSGSLAHVRYYVSCRRHDGGARALLQSGTGLQALPHLQWHGALAACQAHVGRCRTCCGFYDIMMCP